MHEDFWEDLLTLVEDGKVIPVVGERAVTKAPDDAPLYPWLALRLAERLGISSEGLPEIPSLNQVVTAWLLKGGECSQVYNRVHQILRNESPAPGSTLRQLASVPAFNLFVSTTFDRLLERALNDARFGGAQRTQSCAYCPEAPQKDLPARKRDLSLPTVYHIFGRVAGTPEFVVWEEDALEFICALQQELPAMENLARDLKEHGLLIFGLNFSDWLLRFFLRVAKPTQLSESRRIVPPKYLVEGPPDGLPQSMVLFFGGMKENVYVVPYEPAAFATELAERWHSRQPHSKRAQEKFLPPQPVEMPEGAIFLSYAREDEAAAVRLKTALEQAGLLVWYDRERLKPGQYWPGELEEAVSKRCSLFISVISKTTENTVEAYYHRERSWAAHRSVGFAPGEEFYFPVVIDDSPFSFKREPKVAKTAQAIRAPGGSLPDALRRHFETVYQRRTQLPVHIEPQPLAWLESLDDKQTRYPIRKSAIRIGRKPDNDIILKNDTISGHHAEILRRGSQFIIADLGSSNHVFVAGKEVERSPLKDGDIVELGEVRLRFLQKQGEGEG
jgi:FHA domain/TIR domain/SIR2-like domain